MNLYYVNESTVTILSKILRSFEFIQCSSYFLLMPVGGLEPILCIVMYVPNTAEFLTCRVYSHWIHSLKLVP